jgi:hypothetical protein
MRGRGWWSWSWFVAWCAAAVCVGVTGVAFVHGRLAEAGDAAAVLGVSVLVVGVFSWANSKSPTVPDSTDGQLECAASTLARLVRAQWRAEVGMRALRDPFPLAVHWAPGGGDLRGLSASACSFRCGGDGDDLGRLVEFFRTLPRQRLVVLGAPGSGKTTLAVMLALGLAQDHRRGDPVPVLVSVASWDPRQESVSGWLERRVARDYPSLGDTRAYGGSAIRDLIADRRILPLLDGLDELPAMLRAQALIKLKRAFGGDGALVLTCRSDEYRQTTAMRDMLSGAQTIEALPVRACDVIEFLRGSVASGALAPRWQPVFDALDAEPGGPVAHAFSSPLMVSLARDVYAGPGTQPAGLADRTRFPDRLAIELHLLDALIPALLAPREDAPAGALRTGRFDPGRAAQWLAALAVMMNRQGTYDLAWWRLRHELPVLEHRRRRALLVTLLGWLAVSVVYGPLDVAFDGAGDAAVNTLVLGFGSALAVGIANLLTPSAGPGPARAPRRRHGAAVRRLVSALTAASGFGLVYGLALAILYGPMAGIQGAVANWLLVALIMGTPAGEGLLRLARQPSRLNLRASASPRPLFRTFAASASAGIGGGTALGCAMLLAVDFGGDHRALWPLAGPAYGLAAGLGLAVATWAHTPMQDHDAISPGATLRTDRALALFLAVPLMLAFMACLATAFAFDPPYGVPGGLPGLLQGAFNGFAIGFMVWLAVCLNQAWTLYLISTTWLAARGRLPRRLPTFLDYAHRAGLLRQVGAVYQFRHARLQDHLAHPPLLPGAPGATLPNQQRGHGQDLAQPSA